MPKRSERIAKQKLANISAAKRGEHIMMCRFGIAKDNDMPTSEAKRAYDAVYRSDLRTKHKAAIKELFPTMAAKQHGHRL